MAMLANCWLIIEIHLIPYGFKKWFYLSFYIHPFFLFFCQILLWIKTLKRFIFFVVFFVTRVIFSHVFGVLRRFLIIARSFSGFGDGSKDSEVEDLDEDLWYEVDDDSYGSSDTGSGILFLRYEAGGSCEITKIAFCDDVRVESVDQETVSVCSSSDLDDERSSSFSDSGASSFSLGTHRDMEVISHIPSSSSSASPEDQEVEKPEKEEEEKDLFYKSYTERMSWFDLLNQERTFGLNAFLTKKRCSNVEKRILKSLESDIEMVYVAQSCLSWEALHDQYRKLEVMVASACAADTSCTSEYGALITCTLATKFQRFQILLDRFMEDERCVKGKRYLNFIQKRSSLKSLLQVPQISENVDNEKDGRNGGMMIRATDVLKAIEKCMTTFKSFIEVDEKQSWWRASGRLSWNRSPLEDPRDSNLLHDLTRTLRQKELWMKDLKGKTRCLLRRRVEHLGDVQNKEMMFTMIELKLVARVLMMSVISTSQLQWCQQKLDNIEISHGRITRSYTGSLLFPTS
ncbi:hypothetical protein L6452_44504 [Arctium lappa]|uniref:Uncharacterized protein n=1 Tax=Arctium lappa TaxID=4217 RepID=A0ACB8XGA2_ARCLA|nr:hypothetical protein L6452_44504 [Arctium lappa]